MAKKVSRPKRKTAKPKAASTLNSQRSTPDYIVEDLRPLAVEIGRLKLDPQNARRHDQQNIAAIAASLKEYGQLKPLVANRRNGQVLAGNGTLQAARQLGWSHLAVVWGEYDEKSQRGFSIADNRTAELADWDLDILSVQIMTLEAETPDLAAAWNLAELKHAVDDASPTDEKDQKASTEEALPEHYQVIIECENEDDQKQTYEKLQTEGRKCRLLTL